MEKPGRGVISGAVCAWSETAEIGPRLAAPIKADPTADLLDAVTALIYLVISVPAYLLVSVALAAALYVRCAGVLLQTK